MKSLRTFASFLVLTLAACGGKQASPPLAPLTGEPTTSPPVVAQPGDKGSSMPPMPQGPPPEVPAPMSFELPASPATVTLINAGPGKAKAISLRYAPTMGQHQLTRVSIDAKLVVSGEPDSTSPTVTVDLDLEVTRVGKTDFDVKGMILGAAMVDQPGATPVRPEERAELDRVIGSTLTSTVSTAGQWGPVKVDVPAGTSITRELFNTLGVGLGTTLAFPDKAVRKGGSWTVALPFELAGVQMIETTTYDVTAITAKQVDVKATVVVTGIDQTINETGMSIGVSKIGGTGAATYTATLIGVVPTGQTTATTAMTYSANGDSFSSVLTLGKTLAPAPATAAVIAPTAAATTTP